MAPLGPFARMIAQVIVPVVAVLARAIPAAYAQALQNARKSGVDANSAAQATNFLRKTMSKSEALQVLNLSEGEATAEAISKQYEKYMAANDVSKGGSFYLQSKVYRAKEQLDEYLAEKKMEDKSGGSSGDNSKATTEEGQQQQQTSSGKQQ